MPLLDGASSTRLIRAFEKEKRPEISPQALSYGRIPIIAVPASLSESSLDDYLNTGFDGWILKPIDFSRSEAIMTATHDEPIRQSLLYGNDTWDKGGWFRAGLHEGDLAITATFLEDDVATESGCETPQQE
jgi:hypothetical protein